MQAIINEAYSMTFTFLVEGEYASFDENETTYTVYDNSGAAIMGHIDVPVDIIEGQNRVIIEISSAVQTVAVGKIFEKRTIVLKTKFEDVAYSLRESYYVTDYLNYTVNPAEVISLMGIRDGEVLEPEVDLVAAYVRVSSAIGPSILSTALAAGDITQIKANDAIRAQAALDLSRTIELRAWKKMGGDSLGYTRFDGIDFDKIRANLAAVLQAAIADVNTTSDNTPLGMFIVTVPTDPVTGV